MLSRSRQLSYDVKDSSSSSSTVAQAARTLIHHASTLTLQRRAYCSYDCICVYDSYNMCTLRSDNSEAVLVGQQ
jgi:hypothetical protein